MTTWRPVNSTNVEAVGWNRDGAFVRFHSGGTYFYRGVSRQRAVAMTRAKSVGRYFMEKIRDRYDTERVDG